MVNKLIKRLTLSLLSITLFLFLYLFVGGLNLSYAASITWDGGGNDTICGGAGTGNNWSCKQNWNGDTVPGSADTVTFNSTSTKDSTVDATHSGVLTSITLNSGYTGTLSLARSLNTTQTFSIASGTFTAGANNLDVDAGFTINGGVFNAPSTTLFAGGTFTISSGTFTHNSGTVTFDTASSPTISCNNVTFNLVTFTHTSSTKTVSSNCSLPLGNNPTIGGSGGNLTLNGTLSGTGTITFTAAFTNNASTSTLSGFSGVVVGGAFSNTNSAVLNLGSYTTADFNSTFTLTNGTFTAPSGTMTAASTFSLNGGTFNANGGTLTFDGTATATISCSGASFNLVTFAHTSGTKTISSNCGLPVGSNPTLGTTTTAAITNNGAATGSGTLTFSGAYTHNASSSALTGFSGLVVGSTFTNQNSAALDLGSYTTADFNGAFVLSSGSFTAPSGAMSIAGALTISGSPTFNANGGTITFDGSSVTLTCNNVVFNNVVINSTAGQQKTIGSSCTLPLGSNPAVTSIILNGTLTGSGTITKASSLTLFGLTMNAGASLSASFTGISNANPLNIAGATFDASNYTLTNICSLTISSGVFISPANIDLSCLFSQTGGTFTAPSGTLTVPQNFTHTAGTFNHNNGTVNLTSTATHHTLLGSTTFYNLTRQTSGTLSFGAGTTQTVLGTLTLTGNEGSPLTLQSSIQGAQWYIDPQGTRNVGYVSVRDSNNANSTVLVARNSTDVYNNTNWNFITVDPPTFQTSTAPPPAPPSCTLPTPTSSPSLYKAVPTGTRGITLFFTSAQGSFDHYALEYGTSSNNYQFAADYIGGVLTTTSTINLLSPNTTYYFRVRAGNSCATGPWSTELVGKTPSYYTSLLNTKTKLTATKKRKKVSTSCTTYTVKRNDILWNIAKDQLGNSLRYKEIINSNTKSYPNLKTSNNLRAGWKLKIGC